MPGREELSAIRRKSGLVETDDERFIRLENELLEKTLGLMGIPALWMDGGNRDLRNRFMRVRLLHEWLRRNKRQVEARGLFGC
jgi:hypothetical protein